MYFGPLVRFVKISEVPSFLYSHLQTALVEEITIKKPQTGRPGLLNIFPNGVKFSYKVLVQTQDVPCAMFGTSTYLSIDTLGAF